MPGSRKDGQYIPSMTEKGSDMKKLAWQSALLTIVLLLFFIINRMFIDNTYTSYIPLSPSDSSSYNMERTNDSVGELRFDQPRQGNGFISVRMRPEKRGKVYAEIHDEHGDTGSIGAYEVGPFMTVFDRGSGGFTGDRTLLIVLTAFFLGQGILVFRAFRRAKGPDFYAYSTIYTAGFSLFLLLIGLSLLTATIRYLIDPAFFNMYSVFNRLISASYQFMFVTFPLILVFAAAMTVSNIALLQHERRRPQNVLGILISLLLVMIPVIGWFLFERDFMGSEMQYRIIRTIESVYCTIFVYFECMLIGSIICGLHSARHIPEGPCDYILILGCGFRKDGTLPPLLRGRVDRAISFWKQQQEQYGNHPILVPSGGQGRNEVMAEAEAMRRYLLSQNVPEESILPEDRSANTYQNMAFSKKLIEEQDSGKEARVIFSTTNYHVFRSGVWASLADLKAEGIGSSTKWWFWPNAFMRECVGLLVNRWKQELLLLLIMIAIFAGLSMII